jgi:hypothetical protein
LALAVPLSSKDWVTIDELRIEVHFVKEGVVLSEDSRASEKFMHGINVLMAKSRKISVGNSSAVRSCRR